MSATDLPADVSMYAVVKPVMPPPTTTTSTSTSRSIFANVGKEAESIQYGRVSMSKLECVFITISSKQTVSHDRVTQRRPKLVSTSQSLNVANGSRFLSLASAEYDWVNDRWSNRTMGRK